MSLTLVNDVISIIHNYYYYYFYYYYYNYCLNCLSDIV